MAIIHTDKTFVAAIPPQEGDCWVEVWVGAKCLGRHPIDDYQAVVDWAVLQASQFLHIVQVVPVSPSDLTQSLTPRGEGETDTPEQRHADRRAVVNAMCLVLRDCPDESVRAGAFDVLVTMRVIQP